MSKRIIKRLSCTCAQLLAVGVLVTSCGGSDDSSAQAADSIAHAAEHVVVKRPFGAEPQGSVIYLGLALRSCGREGPSISRVEVLQRRPRIVIAVYVRYVRATTPGADCPEEQAELSDTVKLAHPVGKRPIYDAFRTPPVKRWPPS
jgi:hypothetical protein